MTFEVRKPELIHLLARYHLTRRAFGIPISAGTKAVVRASRVVVRFQFNLRDNEHAEFVIKLRVTMRELAPP